MAIKDVVRVDRCRLEMLRKCELTAGSDLGLEF